MQIRAIGHASLAIDIAGQHLLCDPWWNGPAYTGQWEQFPPPRVEPSDRDAADCIYISHGHEDHLHVPTLRTIRRDATLLIPRFRDTGMRDFLRTLGFRHVLEIGHGERRQLAAGVHATMYINKEDSILVLEGEGRTLVNANDALHACSRHVVDHLCDQIRARHPRIDTLLLGYGGASWFPNCIQVTDDVGYDALARERVLAESFAYVVRRLGARFVLPFAASFVLLEDRLRWIHAARWRSPSPCEELRRQGAHEIRAHVLLPGDRLLGDQIFPAGSALPAPEEAEAEVERRFAFAISQLRQRHEPDEARLGKILQSLQANVRRRAPRVLRDEQHLLCRIDLRDVPEVSFLADCSRRQATVTRCDRLRLAPMVLATRLAVLEALATHAFGYESIRHGYGATLQLRQRDLPLRKALLAVLGRKPLSPTRAERLLAWARSPRRSLAVWRGDLHWHRLARRLRRGEVTRTNDIYAPDPECWSPLRAEPLPLASAGR